MRKRWMEYVLAGSLILILAACSGTTTAPSPTTASSAGDGQQASSSGIDAASLYNANCKRCHGADRSGGNGPALLPERLTKDPSFYVTTITDGRRGMPAWGSRLSSEQINALVDFILSPP